MRGLLPEPVDHVLAQPDLSLIAPGPLVSELADTLAVVADVESSGGATVFRVSEGSIRRALDSGWSAADLHDFFTRVSRTPVPQALDYLIDDVARQHGRLRVGAIESYVRSDDHGLLSQVLNDRRTAAAELRRLAPGVLVSGLGADEVLSVLREAGYAPAGENPGGAVLTRPAGPAAGRRTPSRQRVLAGARGRCPPAELDGHRAGDPGRRRRAGRPPRRGRAAGAGRDDRRTLELLSRAVREGVPVWLGYVDAQGSGSQRVVQPVSLVGGFLQGYDERRGENRTFAVHRITSVALVEEDQEAPLRAVSWRAQRSSTGGDAMNGIPTVADRLAAALGAVLGVDRPPVRLRAWDGSDAGPRGRPRARRPHAAGPAPAAVGARRARAGPRLRRRRPRHRGRPLRRLRGSQLGRSAGADDEPPPPAVAERLALAAAPRLALGRDRPRPPPPPEEVRAAPARAAHSRRRDAAAITHHYDVGNDFYALVLGPSMVYSCAFWRATSHRPRGRPGRQARPGLPQARPARPGMRLLDVGCGWGSLALHAAQRLRRRGRRHHPLRRAGRPAPASGSPRPG